MSSSHPTPYKVGDIALRNSKENPAKHKRYYEYVIKVLEGEDPGGFPTYNILPARAEVWKER